MSRSDDAYRLFFALWPDQALREQIEERARPALACTAGRRIMPGNFHITLLFIGNVGRAELQQAQATASAVHVPGFDLSLDCIQTPRRTDVVWAGSQQANAALSVLVAALRAGNSVAPADRALCPHVTLARHPQQRIAPQAIEPVHWAARDFVLVSSVPGTAGSAYTVIGRWSLQPPV